MGDTMASHNVLTRKMQPEDVKTSCMCEGGGLNHCLAEGCDWVSHLDLNVWRGGTTGSATMCQHRICNIICLSV
jgi:hypothetical protein